MANRGAVGAFARTGDMAALGTGYKPTAVGTLGRIVYYNRAKGITDSGPQSPNPLIQRRIQAVDSDAAFSAE